MASIKLQRFDDNRSCVKGLDHLLKKQGLSRKGGNFYPKGPDKCKDKENCTNPLNFVGFRYFNKEKTIYLEIKKQIGTLDVNIELSENGEVYTAYASYNSEENQIMIDRLPEGYKSNVLALFDSINNYTADRNL